MSNQQTTVTSFTMPDQDETQWIIDSQIRTYPYNIQSMRRKSPTLPLHFTKQYLPTNLCEQQLINSSQCLLRYHVMQTDKTHLCALQLTQFQMCRRVRDLRIFDGIRKWETQHVGNLDRQNRGMYMMGLGRKLSRLEEDYSRQPSTVEGIKRANQIEAQVKQMRWRIDYLKKHIETF